MARFSLKNPVVLARLTLMGAAAILVGAFLWLADVRIPRSAPPTSVVLNERAAPGDGDPIARFLSERTEMRAAQLAQLEVIAQDPSASPEIRESARAQQMALMDFAEKETTIEGVLRARGYQDAVATVHAGSVNILVRAASLSREERAVILDLAVRESGQSAANVRIVPLNE